MLKKYAIDYKEAIPVNGTRLHLRVRGTDAKNPLLLFLHGGPGVCDRHWVLKYQSGLSDVCTLVCFDQRGSGKSYTAEQAKRAMTIDQMVEDARIVIEYLCAKYKKDKLYIVGHSWGTCLGTLLCQRYPEHIAAYVGMGQFVNGSKNEQLSYDFVMQQAQKRKDAHAIAELNRIGAPVRGEYRSMDDMMVQRNYMTKFGGGCYREKESMWRSMIIPLLKTPEYTIFDLPRYASGAFYCLRELWHEIVALRFDETVMTLDVPVIITQGDHDQNTPTILAHAWFDALDAPSKKWISFSESAHSPIKEEPEAWENAMRHVLSMQEQT